MLGHKVLQEFEHAYPENTFGTLRGSLQDWPIRIGVPSSCFIENVDLSDFVNLEKILNQIKPDVVLNCVGITLRSKDAGSAEENWRINAYLPHFLETWVQTYNKRLIHYSTDCVFDGHKGYYSEHEQPTATDTYGMSKFAGEVQGENCLTMRLSIIGREVRGKTELVEWFLAQKGKSVKGYDSVYYSGLTTYTVARETLRVVEQFSQLTGLFHVASHPITKYELLKLLNLIFQTHIEIQSDSSKKLDKSLNSQRYQLITGFQPPSWNSMIEQMFLENKKYKE